MLIVCHIIFAISYIAAFVGVFFSINSLILLSIMMLRLGLCCEAITLSILSYAEDKEKVSSLFGLFSIFVVAITFFDNIVKSTFEYLPG